jgi:hypothetical protein
LPRMAARALEVVALEQVQPLVVLVSAQLWL